MGPEFAGRIAAVTGSAREKGYGAAIALEFARRGAAGIVIMSRGDDVKPQAERILDQIREQGSRGIWFQGDLLDKDQQTRLYQVIKGEFGQLNALVNNAGALVPKSFAAMTREEWDMVMNTNVRTPWELSKTLLRLFPRQEGGAIVNVASVIGPYGNRGQISYAASKAALMGFTRALAQELADRNITVNLVNPGYAATDMTAFLDAQTMEIIKEHTPLKRVVKPEEVAFYVVNFCSPRGAFATGAMVDIDGGIGFANIGTATNRGIEAAKATRRNNVNA